MVRIPITLDRPRPYGIVVPSQAAPLPNLTTFSATAPQATAFPTVAPGGAWPPAPVASSMGVSASSKVPGWNPPVDNPPPVIPRPPEGDPDIDNPPPPPGGGTETDNPPKQGVIFTEDPDRDPNRKPGRTFLPLFPPTTLPPVGQPFLPEPPDEGGWTKQLDAWQQALWATLNQQLEGWRNAYRRLGDTSISWYDFVNPMVQDAAKSWFNRNLSHLGLTDYRNERSSAYDYLFGGLGNWINQHAVNYTNPMRLPWTRRMVSPTTDWTRLAGPGMGIMSGFAERSTASPYPAAWRGGSFGPTGRTPGWMGQGGDNIPVERKIFGIGNE